MGAAWARLCAWLRKIFPTRVATSARSRAALAQPLRRPRGDTHMASETVRPTPGETLTQLVICTTLSRQTTTCFKSSPFAKQHQWRGRRSPSTCIRPCGQAYKAIRRTRATSVAASPSHTMSPMPATHRRIARGERQRLTEKMCIQANASKPAHINKGCLLTSYCGGGAGARRQLHHARTPRVTHANRSMMEEIRSMNHCLFGRRLTKQN